MTIESFIASAISPALHSQLTPDAKLADLGVDEIALVGIAWDLEERFGVILSDRLLARAVYVRDLIAGVALP